MQIHTLQQATEHWQKGAMTLLAVYRNGTAELGQWRDKESGRMMTGKRETHNLEVGNKSVQVVNFLPDEYDLSKWVAPAEQNDIVLLDLAALIPDRGLYRARGVITKLARPAVK